MASSGKSPEAAKTRFSKLAGGEVRKPIKLIQLGFRGIKHSFEFLGVLVTTKTS
jgi:hypothetical protein